MQRDRGVVALEDLVVLEARWRCLQAIESKEGS